MSKNRWPEGWAAWADGYGIWHDRVSRTAASPLVAARRVLRDELSARVGTLAPDTYMHPLRVPELDDADTVVFREGLVGGA